MFAVGGNIFPILGKIVLPGKIVFPVERNMFLLLEKLVLTSKNIRYHWWDKCFHY